MSPACSSSASCAARRRARWRPDRSLRVDGWRRCDMPTVIGASGGWTVGLILGIVVVLVAAAVVITIATLRARIAHPARGAGEGVEVVRAQTDALEGIGRINDSGVRILHAARALRKVAVGR